MHKNDPFVPELEYTDFVIEILRLAGVCSMLIFSFSMLIFSLFLFSGIHSPQHEEEQAFRSATSTSSLTPLVFNEQQVIESVRWELRYNSLTSEQIEMIVASVREAEFCTDPCRLFGDRAWADPFYYHNPSLYFSPSIGAPAVVVKNKGDKKYILVLAKMFEPSGLQSTTFDLYILRHDELLRLNRKGKVERAIVGEEIGSPGSAVWMFDTQLNYDVLIQEAKRHFAS